MLSPMAEPLLAELEQETQSTRRALERVPDAHLSWRPHPTSMTLGELALHVATIPGDEAKSWWQLRFSDGSSLQRARLHDD